jgi:hypothetical protein
MVVLVEEAGWFLGVREEARSDVGVQIMSMREVKEPCGLVSVERRRGE